MALRGPPAGPLDVWGTPGGGIDPGEDRLDAVRRELHEETGLEVAAGEVGPVVAHRRHLVEMTSLDGRSWDGQEEWLYLVRVDSFAPRGVFSDEQLAQESLVEIGWFSLAQVAGLGRGERVVTAPRELAGVLGRLARYGRPRTPFELGR